MGRELRKDPATGQWVLVRQREQRREVDADCPFCPGNERLTPPEIAAYRKEGAPANGPGWEVRVIPERDPYFQIEEELVREGVGLYDRISTRGASELLIEDPAHDQSLAAMAEEQLVRVLWMCRDRILDLKRDPRIRDVLVTRRYKKFGARITHPYSRILAAPIIFGDTRVELERAREYYGYKHRCIYCDILREELAVEARIVQLTPRFLAFVPYAARAPYETWILPRQHACSYETTSPEEMTDLARLLKGLAATLSLVLEDPPHEIVLRTAPNLEVKILQDEWATIARDYHWHLRITPYPEHLTLVGGIAVNETSPERAARLLREAWPSGSSERTGRQG